MNLSSIKNVITSTTSRQLLVGQKHSPTILFGVGVVGVIATVVLASRATLNLEANLQEIEDKKEQAKSFHEQNHASYTNKEYNEDMAKLYFRGVMTVVKLYGPAFVIGTASIAALTGSHVILSKRNIGLTAAYAAIEKSFAEYSQRVIGEVGEEKERELRYGTELVSVEKKIGENGKTKSVDVKHSGGRSPYSRLFDNRSSSWSREPSYNMLFLRAQQTYANQRLQSRGHILLNDVFDGLGIERTKAGCVVGWVKGQGDDYIDFGIFDGQNMDRFYDFVAGNEGAIWLDFNVDGVVYDKI